MSNKLTFLASAPSNIALIKYMGKINQEDNRPTNSSLSFTLDELQSFVRITYDETLSADQWRPLNMSDYPEIVLSEKGKNKFLNHFANLKNEWGVQGNFIIESANNFPSDCGLASSASSFAALTKAAAGLFNMMKPKDEFDELSLAQFSRKGSGSSCRSFFGPWALWYSDGVKPLEFPIGHLLHQVIVVESGKKSVSSSEAHKRVASSPLFNGRPERAERRLAELIQAFKDSDWSKAYQLTWSEFWDMHSLFETSSPNFGYLQPGSIEVLRLTEAMWKGENDGPLVTMDAGANVHLLWRQDQKETAQKLAEQLRKKYLVISCKELRNNS